MALSLYISNQAFWFPEVGQLEQPLAVETDGNQQKLVETRNLFPDATRSYS